MTKLDIVIVGQHDICSCIVPTCLCLVVRKQNKIKNINLIFVILSHLAAHQKKVEREERFLVVGESHRPPEFPLAMQRTACTSKDKWCFLDYLVFSL